MGVKKFIATFVAGVTCNLDIMRDTCAGVAIDTNQFIHRAFEKLIAEVCEGKEKLVGGPENHFVTHKEVRTTENLLTIYGKMCEEVLDGVIGEISMIRGLRELYITMDGTPCYGKIQNQIDRRRTPKHLVKVTENSSGGKVRTLLFSSAHILPGTPLMNTFTAVLHEKIKVFSNSHPRVSITLSLTDIPGEGEHKALDYLNASSYTSFNRTEDPEPTEVSGTNSGERVRQRMTTHSFLIWSNDSDVLISLLHRPVVNVFIMTERVSGNNVTSICVSLKELRNNICQGHREIINAPLLLAFVGNDYLPEMLDTADLKDSFTRFKAACDSTVSRDALWLTKEDKPPNAVELLLKVKESDEVMPDDVADLDSKERVPVKPSVVRQPERQMYGYSRVIDFDALRMFCRTMAEQEINLYFTDVAFKGKFGSSRLLRIGGSADEFQTDPVAFKRLYYRAVHNELASVRMNPFPTRNPENPTDSELYDLEMEMATAYLRTYCWYYYYQSGMHTGGSMDNASYPYIFPPLYTSLYLVLDRVVTSQMIRFDPAFNPELRPIPRDLEYFRKLISFPDLHHFIVLQPPDYQLLMEMNNIRRPLFTEHELDNDKFISYKSSIVSDRYGTPLELRKHINVEVFVEKYKNHAHTVAASVVKLGREQPDQTERAARAPDRYRLRNVAIM